ncbi:Oidioi.mRNA.OKI2018_I69.XSR.g14108.t1.cds [Oikopleura dioica]|uniref:Oidioi.mRNA.OKI2018_I69.XSR.g14108.t1.cds n=1 Tax=Oikopleura dioica TaxID=34765 RepID=A0ABN7SCR3_OIKDI|nr:Oidioi.mRNA.OKI2018_I69.XSR.g14108.t1.cds [Oikopleura dioica]
MMRTVFALLSLSSSLPVSEDEFIGTTAATPDLPDFLFKHFGEPPLTDSQMLNILIGSTAIPAELLTEQPEKFDELTTPAPMNLDLTKAAEKETVDLLEVEIIEEIEKTDSIQAGSDASALQSALWMVLPLIFALF